MRPWVQMSALKKEKRTGEGRGKGGGGRRRRGEGGRRKEGEEKRNQKIELSLQPLPPLCREVVPPIIPLRVSRCGPSQRIPPQRSVVDIFILHFKHASLSFMRKHFCLHQLWWRTVQLEVWLFGSSGLTARSVEGRWDPLG